MPVIKCSAFEVICVSVWYQCKDDTFRIVVGSAAVVYNPSGRRMILHLDAVYLSLNISINRKCFTILI